MELFFEVPSPESHYRKQPIFSVKIRYPQTPFFPSSGRRDSIDSFRCLPLDGEVCVV